MIRRMRLNVTKYGHPIHRVVSDFETRPKLQGTCAYPLLITRIENILQYTIIQLTQS